MKKRRVLVNINLEEDSLRAFRAWLLEERDDGMGLLKSRAGSDIPTGLYPLHMVFDARTREPLGL
jgi:hypothetical protein